MKDKPFRGFQCLDCKSSFPPNEARMRCPRCNGLLDSVLDEESLKEMGKDALENSPSMWRFRMFLPVEEKVDPVSAGEGNTPLQRAKSVLGNVWVKNETKNPTGTFKDRGASLAVTCLSQLAVKTIVLSSEGNAGCSFALYSNIAGMNCRVFLPREANPSKVILSRKLGAKVTQVVGTITNAGRRAEQEVGSLGGYNASTFVTPYRHDGKGTMALEICESLGWKSPDYIIYPVGGGVGLVGMWKMFSILHRIGWINNKPRIAAVQPSGCAPVVKAYNAKDDDVEEWKSPKTMALGLKIPKPLAGKWILRSLRESDGISLTVTDEEIRKSVMEVAKSEGLLLEPSSAATFAALPHLYESKLLDKSDEVVLIATGSGLKTLEQY